MRHIIFMALIFVRTTVIFIVLLIVIRLMGKRQIGEMQPFEFVITLLIAELACIPMSDTSIPLLYGVVAIVTIYLLHQIICVVDEKVRFMRTVLGGKPSIVINADGIDYANLKRNNLDVADLVESMRESGYPSLDSVAYAVYESNGNFSVIPKKEGSESAGTLPRIIVDEGQFEQDNLAASGKDEAFFLDLFRQNGANRLKDVILFTLDEKGKGYFQTKTQPYRVLQIPDCKESA